MKDGDILGHEPMGIVEEVGSEVRHVAPGDVAVRGDAEPRVHKGASLFGYTHLPRRHAGRAGRVPARADGASGRSRCRRTGRTSATSSSRTCCRRPGRRCALLTAEDPLGVEDMTSHRLPLEQAPHGYEIFRAKVDGAIKVVLEP